MTSDIFPPGAVVSLTSVAKRLKFNAAWSAWDECKLFYRHYSIDIPVLIVDYSSYYVISYPECFRLGTFL